MKIQNYKKIVGTSETFIVKINKLNRKVKTTKINDYDNVYVSINSSIKPRALHSIIKNTMTAIKEYKIENVDLKIIILSSEDGFNSYGLYDAIGNTVYYNEVISNKDILNREGINIGHIERHEIYHYKQVVRYQNKFGSITENNYTNYIKYTIDMAKKFIDRRGINKDNVSEISAYASKMFMTFRYDEVEAEIYAKKGAGHV